MCPFFLMVLWSSRNQFGNMKLTYTVFADTANHLPPTSCHYDYEMDGALFVNTYQRLFLDKVNLRKKSK